MPPLLFLCLLYTLYVSFTLLIVPLHSLCLLYKQQTCYETLFTVTSKLFEEGYVPQHEILAASFSRYARVPAVQRSFSLKYACAWKWQIQDGGKIDDFVGSICNAICLINSTTYFQTGERQMLRLRLKS